jgi:hypothetical protein
VGVGLVLSLKRVDPLKLGHLCRGVLVLKRGELTVQVVGGDISVF